MQCKNNQSFDSDLILRIFFEVDEFSKKFEAWYSLRMQRQSDVIILGKKSKKTRQPGLSASEMVTILIYYHHSGYKCFPYY